MEQLNARRDLLGPGEGAPLGDLLVARVLRTTAQSITGNVAVSFDTAEVNEGGLWSSGSPDRITIATKGLYVFKAHVLAEYTATIGNMGTFNILARANGGADFAKQAFTFSHPKLINTLPTIDLCGVGDFVELVATDYMELRILPGATHTVDVTAEFSCYLVAYT